MREFTGKMLGPKTERLRFVQACTAEMHMDISQDPLGDWTSMDGYETPGGAGMWHGWCCGGVLPTAAGEGLRERIWCWWGGAPFRLEDSRHVAGVQSARSLACSLDGGWRLKGVPEDIQGL